MKIEHDVSAIGHWDRSKEILATATTFQSLTYAALELRNCIERLCFEYLFLLVHYDRGFTENELKLWEPKKLLTKVSEEAPFFRKHIEFLNLLPPFKENKMHIPDRKWLNSTYGMIGKYVHHMKEEVTEKELNDLRNILNQTQEELFKYVSIRGGVETLSPHAKEIYDKFITNQISSAQASLRLELSDIPKHMINKS